MVFVKARAAITGMGRRVRRATGPWPDPVPNKEASEFEVDLWILSDFVLGKVIPAVGVRPYPLNELLLMTATACRLKPSVVFDWGTHIGVSARVFYECARAFGLGYEIHSVDLPPDASHVEHPGQEHGRLVRGLSGVHLHRGNGVEVALDQWSRLGKPACPLFFVDGDHAFESVRDELTKIFDTVSDAAVIAHDTFRQSSESNYNIGPALAIEKLTKSSPSRFKAIHSGLGLPGMTLILPT
jgi:hypothetical protein